MMSKGSDCVEGKVYNYDPKDVVWSDDVRVKGSHK